MKSKGKDVAASFSRKKHHYGFNKLDEQVLQIIAFSVKMKIESLLANAMSNKLQDEVVSTLKIAGAISSQRSHADFIKQCKLMIP
jgi:hypothetical protein